MFWKISLVLVVLLSLLASPSSAFLPDNCKIDLDPTKIFQEKLEAPDVIKGAVCVGSLLKHNYGLVNKYPATKLFIENVIQKGTSLVAENPAYFGASVYFTALVLVSHYYAIDAKKQLMEAEFIQDDLKMVIENEIVPMLGFIETILIKNGAKDGMKKFCVAKTLLKDTFKNAIDNIRKIRNDIQNKMVDSSSGEDRNKIFQWLSGGAGTGSLAAIALAPCPFTAFLACPALIAGTAGAISSAAGYYLFENNKLTHQKAFQLLEQARLKAKAAEETLRLARVNIDGVCLQFAISESSGINGNGLE